MGTPPLWSTAIATSGSPAATRSWWSTFATFGRPGWKGLLDAGRATRPKRLHRRARRRGRPLRRHHRLWRQRCGRLHPDQQPAQTDDDRRTAPKDLTLERDGLILHGGKRLNKTDLLITEEDYSPGCKTDGNVEIWRLDAKAKLLRFVSEWNAPAGEDASGPLAQPEYCSSHWFTVNDYGVVADGWFGAGVRFLDVSNVTRIRPIGMDAGNSTTASQAVFAPGSNDIVYVADYVRGYDVISIKNGGRGASTITPADEGRVGTSASTGLRFTVKMSPDKRWGWGCAVPSAVHVH